MARPDPTPYDLALAARAARLSDPAVQRLAADCDRLLRAWRADRAAEAARAEPMCSEGDLLNEMRRRVGAFEAA